jgi:hypothetical protein
MKAGKVLAIVLLAMFSFSMANAQTHHLKKKHHYHRPIHRHHKKK